MFVQHDVISVIVPIYKVEKYLTKCIDSILGQTYDQLEIILVDDGSPDNCGKICDIYKKNDSRIKVIHKRNGGLSDARNAGMQIATGNYIGFVDGDDYIAPDMYEHLYSVMKKNNADVGVCNACIVSEDRVAMYTEDNSPIVLRGKQSIFSMICDRLFTVNSWNKLYKRYVFDGIEFPVGKLYEDLATTYKVLDRANIVVVSKAQKYAYVQREGSIMNQNGSKIKRDKIDIIEEMWDYFSKSEIFNLDELKAGIIRYIIIDIFKMIGSKSVKDNPDYRKRLKQFMKDKNRDIFGNHNVSAYHKMILHIYLECPAILACAYHIKGGLIDA